MNSFTVWLKKYEPLTDEEDSNATPYTERHLAADILGDKEFPDELDYKAIREHIGAQMRKGRWDSLNPQTDYKQFLAEVDEVIGVFEKVWSKYKGEVGDDLKTML